MPPPAYIFAKGDGSGIAKRMVNEYKALARIGFLFVMMYMIGAGLAGGVNVWKETSAIAHETKDWGLGFGEAGQKPTGNTSAEELCKQDAWYVGNTQEKVLYLTFDAGFENGNTPVGNHSYHHPDMTAKSDEEFEKEIRLLEEKYKEITGEELTKFYRPPQGKYSDATLKHAKQMGYQTFFWSLAYVDWLEKDQPTKEEAFEKLLGRIHPGAIVLLHSTSATNAQILDELLTKWEEMGYEVRSLSEIS